MLWLLKRTALMRWFFWAPKHMLKIMGKKIFTHYADNFCFKIYAFNKNDMTPDKNV